MRISIVVLLVACFAVPAQAQSFEVGAHVASARWSEFDGADNGAGGRVTWKPSSTIGVDAEMTWYPSDFPDAIAFTRSRTEGLFGATVGPSLNGFRPFAKAAAGLLKVGPTPGAFACIAIFPPPLNCALAGGDTLAVFELGGGAEVSASSRAFVRGDVGYRFIQYPGPTFADNFELRDEGWWGGALRLTIGLGWRF